MKSICFLLTKIRATISSIALADMKLIIVLQCSMLKLANAPSLRLYTHDIHVIWFMKISTLRTNHKPIAWLHWVIHYFWGMKNVFPNVWFWQYHLLRNNHEWDYCTSTFCSCRQFTHSCPSNSHLQKLLYFA